MEYRCTECQSSYSRWSGQCPRCGLWNTLVETSPTSMRGHNSVASATSARYSPHKLQEEIHTHTLDQITTIPRAQYSTGSSEFDRCLGGGLVLGSVLLLSGEPGIGKSTLLLQTAGKMTIDGTPVRCLYISAEESLQQQSLRATRLAIPNNTLFFSQEKNIARIESGIISTKAQLVIIDSIQAMRHELGTSSFMSDSPISLLRNITALAREWAETHHCAIILAAHVTKEGSIAGPKFVEHMVDTIVQFDKSYHEYRFISVRKNRFGSSNEIAIFKMSSTGLLDITEAEQNFVKTSATTWAVGTCICAYYEGTRSFLIEIQALTVSAYNANKVFSDVVDTRKIFRIAAVLEKCLAIPFSQQNIYINTSGSMYIRDSGADLSIALALLSAYKNKALTQMTCAVGEISLSGMIRNIEHMPARYRQCSNFGIPRIIVPQDTTELAPKSSSTIKVKKISHIRDIAALLE